MYYIRPIIAYLLRIILALFFAIFPFVLIAQNDMQLPSELSNLPSACGDKPIFIAQTQWPSAAILANIHAQILTNKFGCKTEIIPRDATSTASSMATTGHPTIAPEMWIVQISDIWNISLENDIMRKAAPTFSGSPLQAWFIPDYIAQNHPQLKNISQLKNYWRVFSHDGKKAKFLSCPKEWACSIINRNILRAYGLDNYFTVIEPKNRYELDNIIASAVSRREPILFYYWQPNSLLAQFNFLQLNMGDYDLEAIKCLAQIDCKDPKPSSFPPEQVNIILASWIFSQSPQIASYFQRATMPIDEMNKLLALQAEGKSIKEVANYFVSQREEIWQNWVGNKLEWN